MVVAMHIEATATVAFTFATKVAFIRSMATHTMVANPNIKVVLGVAAATTFACLVATAPFPFIYFQIIINDVNVFLLTIAAYL